VELGLYGETAEARILEMARRSARFTHPDANRRFRQYIMFLEADGMVTMLDIMSGEEADYYDNRSYAERKAEDDPGEAEVIKKKR